MNRLFKEITYEINKAPWMSAMLVVQFFLCFAVCQIAFCMNFSVSQETQGFKDKYVDTKYYSIMDEFYDLEEYSNSTDFTAKLKVFYNYLSNNKDFDYFAFFTQPVSIKDAPRNISLIDGAFESYDEATEYYKADPKHNFKSGKYTSLSSIIIDKKALDFYNIEIESGRTFNSKDYLYKKSGDIIPILLGSNYHKYYKIGSQLRSDTFIGNFTFKVIGFIKKDSTMSYISSENNVKSIDVNNNIIMPYFNGPDNISENIATSKLIYLEKNNGIIASKLSPNVIQSLITKKCNELGINPVYRVESATNTQSNALLLDAYQISNFLLYISGILVAFSILTLTLFLVNCIKKNLKYYAILLTNGFTYRNVIFIIIGQPILFSLISFNLVTILMFLLTSNEYNSTVLIGMLCLLLLNMLIILISSFFALRELKRHDLAIYLRKR